MSRLHDDFFFDSIDKLLLFKEYNNLITYIKLIEQCKNVIVVSFCPWEIRTMTKDKTIS